MKTDNELIAEFMGLQVYGTHEQMRAVPIEDLREWAYIEQLDYDNSWNWLMPVVEKISQHVYESFPDEGTLKHDRAYPRTFGMIDDEGRFMVRINRSSLCYGDTLIEATYVAVIDWIKLSKLNPKP